MNNSTSNTKEQNSQTFPLVPLRDIVLFPEMLVPFVVGRRESIEAVKRSLSHNNLLFLATQKNPSVENPAPEDIETVGTLGRIVQNVELDGGHKLLVRGIKRGTISDFLDKKECFFVELSVNDREEVSQKDEELANEVMELFKQYIKLQSDVSFESVVDTVQDSDLSPLTDSIAAHLDIEASESQKILEIFDPLRRARHLKSLLDKEIKKLKMDKELDKDVKSKMQEAQKKYFLNEKMKAIKQELGEKGGAPDETQELREKIKNAGMPEDVEAKALKELNRLESMPSVSSEATVTRNYIDWLIDMPWNERTQDKKDLEEAERILDEDHYDLEDVKERILEYLAVKQLTDSPSSSILCFVGPPGVGKSSLARSIARATGREFVRHSLGGIKDEAEIRGHRRTYIGAFPGQIVQNLKKAGTMNPVFLLDEVDKINSSFRGDPAAALMEVLDPEQNDTFLDHFLDVEFDLSEIMFIATANVLDTVPPALIDRMEIIRIPGYTIEEKVNIGKKFLLPKQIKEHGLDKERIELDDVLPEIIEKYTREAGVRNLERSLGKVCRKVAKKYVSNKDTSEKFVIDSENIEEFLGVPEVLPSEKEEESQVGLAAGLAVTQSGGEILLIEAEIMTGEGELNLTGNLGDVMKESAEAGLSFLRANNERFDLEENFHTKIDIHLHVPQGSVPKEGPSAGIPITVSFLSALKKIPVRQDVGMTGEITLRGKTLPVGGIKEKTLKAHRADLSEVILPAKNRKDEEDIPEDVLKDLHIHYVENIDEVLEIVLHGEY